MKYKVQGTCGEKKADTMIGLMKDCRVFSLEQNENGNVVIFEACDDCFGVELTKEQVLALAQELIDLANWVTE